MGQEIYATEELGPKQSMTPEGFLICSDVPVARTGIMVYGPHELQDDNGNLLKSGPDGLIYVSRDPADIFNLKTISSFEGKPVTVNHPDVLSQLVDSENWKDLARGHARNIRRGN